MRGNGAGPQHVQLTRRARGLLGDHWIWQLTSVDAFLSVAGVIVSLITVTQLLSLCDLRACVLAAADVSIIWFSASWEELSSLQESPCGLQAPTDAEEWLPK